MNQLRLEYRTPSELADNPKNWREHPKKQTDALSAVIDKVGWAGACLYNERTGRLIDGHARKKLASGDNGQTIPVLIGSWSEEDEALILATLDPIASMAETNDEKLSELIGEIDTDNQILDDLLNEINNSEIDQPPPENPPELTPVYAIHVELPNEDKQHELWEYCVSKGFKCRVLTM